MPLKPFHVTCHMTDDGRQPQQKMPSTEENLNGKRPQRMMTSMEDYLMEDDLNGR